MSNDTIISFSDPAFHDELTELVRGGCRAQKLYRCCEIPAGNRQ